MSTRPLHRAERLAAIERLLFRHTKGLRAVEIAEACAVDRRTVYRDLALLDKIGIPVFQEDGRFYLNREYYLASVRLNFNEAVTLFLAARLLARHAEQQNPHSVSALTKLSQALPEPIATHVSYIAESVRANPIDRNFVQTLETVTRGWAERRKVKLWGSLIRNTPDVRAHEFATYFIEPLASGELYAIGYDDLTASVRAFKLEAVKRAKLMDVNYTIPSNLDRRLYLASMWGVGGGDGEEKTRVVLAFSPDVTPLIKERTWHDSQRIETLEDKRCTLSMQVADWRALLPWIRSWGTQVEVLEPPSLRYELASEARRLVNLYSAQARS